MRFLPTTDQRALAQSVRDALAKYCSADDLRSKDHNQRTVLWSQLGELGVFALTIDEDCGGLGLDQRDAVGVYEETGRAGAPGPIAEAFAISQCLQAAAPSTRRDEILAGIAEGTIVATLGLGEDPLIESADIADLIVAQHGDDLHALTRDDVELVHQPVADVHRHLFTMRWQPTPSTLLASPENSFRPVELARDHLLLAAASQLVGLSKRLLEMTVHHVSTREQFGRPLGTLQAVQHRLADVAVAIEFAEPVVARSACSLAADGVPSVARDAAMAKVFASDAAERAAYTSLQLHGAIGYTREHDLHLYAQRAWSLALAHGDARRHRARVADDLLGAHSAPRYPTS
jgi:alkylation response protein AidB-like acyl-CoA dehydrogenase